MCTIYLVCAYVCLCVCVRVCVCARGVGVSAVSPCQTVSHWPHIAACVGREEPQLSSH